MTIGQKIREMAEAMLASESHFIVDVRVTAGRSGGKVVVYLDGDEGVSIDECAELSRSLGEKLEEEDVFDNAYTLEVSTPGIDHPLESERQYRKNIGRELRILLNEGKELKGKLLGVDSSRIVLEKRVGKGKKASYEEVEIPLSEINKSIVQISFK